MSIPCRLDVSIFVDASLIDSPTTYIALSDLAGVYSPEQLRWVRRHATHTALNGEACMEADQLDDLLGLHAILTDSP